MIQTLQTHNVGPLEDMELEFAHRLNLITGNNGLGKSFILDLIWYGLTRQWPQNLNAALASGGMARPRDVRDKATIRAKFAGLSRSVAPTAEFDSDADSWRFARGKPVSPGLVFYAMADGSFAVWDPMRNRSYGEECGDDLSPAFVFSARQALNGLPDGDDGWLCEGLIKDWGLWENSIRHQHHFELMKRVLKLLSDDGVPLVPGRSRQVRPRDIRAIPTIRMPYGEEVPIHHASSGVRRIVTLAYLLMWSWLGHKSAAEARGKDPEERMTFLFDEVEAHLHPQWQRTIVPALLQVADVMTDGSSVKPKVQFVVTTHSPLVMSSVEADFDSTRDRWFDLDCAEGKVALTQRTYVAQGDADAWLKSEAFDLGSSYSVGVERVIAQSRDLLRSTQSTEKDFREMTERLGTVLSETDSYWIIWTAEMFKRGIR